MTSVAVKKVRGSVIPNSKSFKGNRVAVKNISDKATLELIQKAEEYLIMNRELSELKAKVEELKGDLKKEMKGTKQSTIHTSVGSLTLTEESRVQTSGEFTKYEYETIASYVKEEVLEKITERRVNASKLESLVKLEEIPQSILLKHAKKKSEVLRASYLK